MLKWLKELPCWNSFSVLWYERHNSTFYLLALSLLIIFSCPIPPYFYLAYTQSQHSLLQLSLLFKITKPSGSEVSIILSQNNSSSHIKQRHLAVAMDREYFQHTTLEAMSYTRRLVSSTIAIVLYLFVVTYTFSAVVPSALTVIMAIMSVVVFNESGLTTIASGDIAFRTSTSVVSNG